MPNEPILASNESRVRPNPSYRVWRQVDPIERDNRLQAVIERFLCDEKLADIAKDIGLSHSALCMALLEYAEDDWKRAQIARAIGRLEKSRDTREAATDMLNLVRARDDEKSAQWELERLLRRLYGPDAMSIQINNIVAPEQVLIQIAELEDRLGMRIVDNSLQSVHEPSQDRHTHVMSNTPALPKK